MLHQCYRVVVPGVIEHRTFACVERLLLHRTLQMNALRAVQPIADSLVKEVAKPAKDSLTEVRLYSSPFGG